MPTDLLSILIVEDQSMFREFLFVKCQELYPDALIRGCGQGTEAVSLCALMEPRLALIDINLPDCDGLELGQQLLTLYPQLRVIGISGECGEALIVRLKAVKISGFIDKNEHIDALAVAIYAVLAGRSYYSSSLREHQMGINREANAWPKLLSDAEIKLLPYLGANLPIVHIAAIFHISDSTVLWHRKNIKTKLDLRTDSDLMHFCTTKGFVLVGGGRVRPVKMSSLGSIPTR
jgi:DNA-binding NarL/FixJ family response regulator